MNRIPISGPSITQKEIDYVTDAVTNAWFANHAVYHNRFETAFAEYHGIAHAVSLPHCTAGLHLALAALGVGPGNEVIVPDATWIACSAPITYVGATAVFADIDESTWCITPESFAACITPRTKAVIAVNLYGSMVDFDRLLPIANEHGIAVIEDAAEAVGSQLNGRHAGVFGDAGVFSFHGSKTMTTGEGGMLITDRQDLYDRILFLRDHGRPPGDTTFHNTEVAYKYKMSAMQAALGLAQTERLDELTTTKRQIFTWYQSGLDGFDGITLNVEPDGVLNSYWMVTIILDPRFDMDKHDFIARISERNVDCRPFFHPLSSLPAYANTVEADRARHRNTVSYAISPYGVNLPSGMNLTEETVDYVCQQIKNLLGD